MTKLGLVLVAACLYCSCADTREPVASNANHAESWNAKRGGSESSGNQRPSVVVATPKASENEPLMERATKFPQPEYPAAAKAVRATGQVAVQVTVSEGGKVVSASALTGHPLLKKAAVDAALKAEFRPLLVNGQPKSESGILTYDFMQ